MKLLRGVGRFFGGDDEATAIAERKKEFGEQRPQYSKDNRG